MLGLAILFGAVVGFSLGLTGGGGSIIAVPLLVYGLAVAPREAIGISLAAVGATALVGAVQRLRRGEVEVRVGLMFALAGMAGAPVGSWISRRVPEAVLLVLFALLMLTVALRMWLRAVRRPEEAAVVRATLEPPATDSKGPACRRDPAGRLRWTSRCARVMSLTGLITGILSGMFGVGGGFVIVPALVFLSGMSIHRAVATSLLVIALISGSGLAAYLIAGQPLQSDMTLLFVIGGVTGMAIGTLVARMMSPILLQKVFALAIVLVAVFVLLKNLL